MTDDGCDGGYMGDEMKESDKQLFEDSSESVLLEGTQWYVRNGGHSGFDSLL